MFDSVRIHSKLAMAMAVPLAALVGISALVVVVSRNDATRTRDEAATIERQVQAVALVIGPSGLLKSLQTERNGESMALLGISPELLAQLGRIERPPAGVNGTEVFRQPTDEAVTGFRRTLADQAPAIQEIYAPAIARLDELGAIRAETDAYQGTRGPTNVFSTAIYTRYTAIIETFFDAAVQVGSSVDDRTLRTALDILDLAARQKESATENLFRSQLQYTADPTRDRKAAVAAEAAKVTQIAAQLRRLSQAEDEYRAIIDAHVNDENWMQFMGIIADLERGGDVALTVLRGPVGSKAFVDALTLQDRIGEQLNRDAQAVLAQAEATVADAEDRARNVVVLAGLMLLAATAVAFVASRSISRPLHRLAGEADDMGNRRLPEAVHAILETRPGEDIDVPELADVLATGGAEIVEVAEALNSVQGSAAGLAVEQAALRRNIAESFVNLGRRSQNLLSRQLDSISEMEQNETDPDMLERLFVLDHLATRMRRNAESLLLLGGLEPQRQWTAPIPIADTVRAALGEVEAYQRVAIEHLDEVMVNGSAVTDVTHMLAELLENALVFSPADSPVEIVGRGTGNAYTLTVADHGPGMSPEDLERSRRRITGEESYTLAPSRHLGHYVVGIQARRLGIAVELRPGAEGGLVAVLQLDTVLSAPALPEPVASEADAVPATWSQFADSAPAEVADVTAGAPAVDGTDTSNAPNGTTEDAS